jgi:hypothetical protein
MVATRRRTVMYADGPYVTTRDEVITSYRGAMSRLDGPCQTRHTRSPNVGDVLEFTWKVHGKTARAGGLPVEERTSDDAPMLDFWRHWGDRSGYLHRHSGPACTMLTKDDPAGINWMYSWYSRGYGHRAAGPSCGDTKECRVVATIGWYQHYGVRYDLN